MKKNISSGVKKTSKTKILATLIASFVVFFSTLFALAENKNANSLFLDSDQDGLTDQEEAAIGTNSNIADTDGDGYSDGKEVESGYSPLKPAPGDSLIVKFGSGEEKNEEQPDQNQEPESSADQPGVLADDLGLGFSGLTNDDLTNLESDPQNPNLTNEMLGQLMQLTKDKAESSDSFLADPAFTAEDYAQIAQQSLDSVDIEKELPEIKDSEIKILPPVDDEDLEPEEAKEKQKEEIEKYLAQTAFVMASNSPFPVENPNNLQSNLEAEGTNLVTALASGNQEKMNYYAEKAQTGIEQVKNIEVPYILKDMHKSMLQLALYTIGLKDSVVFNTDDPMKSLVAASSLGTVAENAAKLQGEFSQILSDYGIESVNFP